MKSVDRLLQASRSEGALKGEGTFSLSTDRAVAKLSRYGLDGPEKGLLRLVQVAQIAGCLRLYITLDRSTLTIVFEGIPRENLSLATLKRDLNLDANNFPLALLACLHSGFESGRVEDTETAWMIDQEGFRRADPAEPIEGLTVTLKRQAPSGFWERLRALLRRRCLDQAMLQSALRHNPLPLLLDGAFLLPDLRPRSKLLYELFLEGPKSLIRQSISRPEIRSFRFWRDGEMKEESRGAWRTFKIEHLGARLSHFVGEKSGTYRRKSGRRSALLAHLWVLTSSKESGGHLTLVADGVVVGEARCEFPLPFQAVVSASGLDRDLSGLGVIHNEKLERFQNYLTKVLTKRLRNLKHHKLPESLKQLLMSRGFLKGKKRLRSRTLPGPGSAVYAPRPPKYDPRSDRSQYLTMKRRAKNRFR